MKVDSYSITRFYVLGKNQISVTRGKHRFSYTPNLVFTHEDKFVSIPMTRKVAADTIRALKKTA